MRSDHILTSYLGTYSFVFLNSSDKIRGCPPITRILGLQKTDVTTQIVDQRKVNILRRCKKPKVVAQKLN